MKTIVKKALSVMLCIIISGCIVPAYGATQLAIEANALGWNKSEATNSVTSSFDYINGTLTLSGTGKADNAEIDFVAAKADEKIYVQVTESMTSEDVRRRELSPLQKVRDNYEKTVLSLDPGLETSYEVIRSRNLIEWLIT